MCRLSRSTKKGSRGCNLAQFSYCAFVNTAFTVAVSKVSAFLQLTHTLRGTLGRKGEKEKEEEEEKEEEKPSFPSPHLSLLLPMVVERSHPEVVV